MAIQLLVHTTMASFFRDIRLAVRMLAKSPGATALCVVSIALAIGLTTGLFSLVDAAYLRPFPFQRPGEILTATSIGDDGRVMSYDWADYEDMALAAKGLAELSAYSRRGVLLKREEGNEFVLAYPVSSNHFSFLGVRTALGRASLDPVQGRPAVVLGHGLWQRRFSGDPGIIGETVILNNRPFTVTAVMPKEFTGLMRGVPNDVWMTTEAWFGGHNEAQRQNRGGGFEIIARLKPGVSPQGLAARLDAAIRGAGKHKPAPKGAVPTYFAARFALNWTQQLAAGAGLMVVLGLVLFVGCANAAQLRLAQAEERKRELAVRRALGAGWWRVTRLLLTETALVSAAGAGLGVLLASCLIDKATTFVSTAASVPLDLGIRLDHRVLLCALALALVSVLAAGLAPSRYVLRLNVNDVLKSGQGAAGGRVQWRKRLLVVGQIAISVLFFGMAALGIENARNAAAVRPGLDPSKKLFVMLVAPGWHWPISTWCQQARERLSRVPGVRGATFATRLPLDGIGSGNTVRVEVPGQAPLGVTFNSVAGNYFPIMGTRVLAGRGIEPGDGEGSPLVTVVSQQFARQVFHGRYPVGEWISIDGKMRQVVGVVEDGPMGDFLHEPIVPYLYLPFSQVPGWEPRLMVEASGDPDALAPVVRKELARFDAGATVMLQTTLQHHMERIVAPDRFAAGTATALGVFGFLLTGAGLFGVIQYAVSRRTREIGLRVALGARPGEIQKMVLAESFKMAAWGIPIGLLLVAAAAHLTQSLLIGVTALDPLTYASSAALAVALALLAAWLPAARAASVDPMTALRAE